MINLNRKLLNLNSNLPEKILVFGEGNFLRAFAGYIVQKLNDSGEYSGGITALQGVESGLCDMINQQDGLYNVIERGIENGKVIERFTLINCLNKCLNPYADYQGYLNIAKNPDLQVIISNTTEFGICYAEAENVSDSVHYNFPAKLTDFLYKRYTHFKGAADKGLVILPCELIDKNGDKLKEIILKYANQWELEKGFTDWLEKANIFTNTLVDRIVSGYPKAEAEDICNKLGYTDNLLDVCEPFLLWVIEGDKNLLNKLPLDKCGLDIIVTDDLSQYRTRKVRILNGAHTMSVLAGHLAGFEIVEQLVNDETFIKYIKKGVFEEIIPAMQGEKLKEYALDVIERFKNPFLNHKLLSISLNSISKFKARVLVSIKDYIEKFGKSPQILSFSLAALLEFYKQGADKFVNDEKFYIEEVKSIIQKYNDDKDIVHAFLNSKILWEEDLTALKGLEDAVGGFYTAIQQKGIKAVIKEISNV